MAVTFRGLPDGAAVEHGVLASRESVLPVIVSAGVDAPLAGALLAVEGRFADDTRTITGGLNQDITLIEGQNQTIFDTRRVDRLAMAVTEPAPFEVRVVETKAPVVRGARKHLRVTAIRAEGFTAPINVYVPFLPGGFGAGQVDIPENQTEADLVLEAKGDAPLGELPVVVQGASAGWLVCSPFAPIQVEAPWVTFAVANVEAEQGASAEAVVTLSHARD
ncbi:MAG: hypothetical protein QN131_10100, partial [Armatimonadota bacterium]|nr:hypothetical protein [Armatimonadota bacterium]